MNRGQTETPLLPNPHEYVLHDILCKFLRDETAGEYDQAGRIFVIDAIETAEVPPLPERTGEFHPKNPSVFYPNVMSASSKNVLSPMLRSYPAVHGNSENRIRRPNRK